MISGHKLQTSSQISLFYPIHFKRSNDTSKYTLFLYANYDYYNKLQATKKSTFFLCFSLFTQSRAAIIYLCTNFISMQKSIPLCSNLYPPKKSINDSGNNRRLLH
ncbi:hypothetical protein AAZX31_19G007100 [Glycine max]